MAYVSGQVFVLLAFQSYPSRAAWKVELSPQMLQPGHLIITVKGWLNWAWSGHCFMEVTIGPTAVAYTCAPVQVCTGVHGRKLFCPVFFMHFPLSKKCPNSQ